jgi:hypothetical protein
MDKPKTRQIIRVLMESVFYFDLTLRERLTLIKHLLSSSRLAV